jgi:hypothetical protein
MQAYSGNEYSGRAAAKGNEYSEVLSTPSVDQLTPPIDEKTSAVSQTPIKVPMVPLELLKDLENTIQGMNMKDAPTNKIIDHATKLVQAYLYRHEAEFKRVMVYRDRVCHNPTTPLS